MALDADLELMLRVRSGDAESFEVLLRRYRAPLVNYFWRLVRDRAFWPKTWRKRCSCAFTRRATATSPRRG